MSTQPSEPEPRHMTDEEYEDWQVLRDAMMEREREWHDGGDE